MKRIVTFADRHFRAITIWVSFLFGIMFAILYVRGSFGPLTFSGRAEPFIDELLQNNRSTLYGTLASINGSLLGFSITITSIIFGLSSTTRMLQLQKFSVYRELWLTLTETAKTLGMSTLISLGCLLFDREHAQNQWFVVALLPATMLSIAYLCRTLWILENVIALVTMPAAQRTREAAATAAQP